jgi:hypothetical protein
LIQFNKIEEIGRFDLKISLGLYLNVKNDTFGEENIILGQNVYRVL